MNDNMLYVVCLSEDKGVLRSPYELTLSLGTSFEYSDIDFKFVLVIVNHSWFGIVLKILLCLKVFFRGKSEVQSSNKTFSYKSTTI